MDISAVVVLDETTLQATVNPPPGGGNGEGGASLSDATPQALGPAAAGTALTGSRSDHRHAMPTAAEVGADVSGTAAAAVAAHAAAADPHPSYTTGAEAAAAAPVQSVSLSAPSGWSTSSTNTGGGVTLTLGLPTGFSLPSNTSQANWNTAFSERLRWDGSNTGLNAATGRTSLGLGSASQRDAGTAAGNVPVLDGAGLVPSALLPGFVDDVLEFANIAAFPATGDAGKLYISQATNRQYRWSGSVYTEINPSPGSTDAIPQGSVNLYFTTALGQSAAFSWWSGYRSTIGDQLATAANAAAARTAIGAGTSSLVVSSSAPQPLAAIASAGSTGQAADAGHVHQRDTDVLVVNLSGSASDPTAANTIETFRFTFAAEILASELSSETVASGSAFQVNARLNASSIYSVRPQIAIGSTAGSSGTLAITAAAIGDVLRFDISQAGGGCRLAKLYLTIRRTA